MKIHHLLIGAVAMALMACAGQGSNNPGLAQEATFADFTEGALVGTLAQNESTPNGGSPTTDGNSNGSNTLSSPSAHPPHVHQSGGAEGIFIVDGRLTIQGPAPQLGSDCVGGKLHPGSTDTAGRINLTNSMDRCNLTFSRPFYNPVCVASGGANPILIGTSLLGSNKGFVMTHALGETFKTDVVSYICLDLVEPGSANAPGNSLLQKQDLNHSLGFTGNKNTGQTLVAGSHKNQPLKVLPSNVEDAPLEEYCASIKDQCIQNASGADAKHCLNSYNICVTKTDCETLNQACLHVGIPASQCDSNRAACDHDQGCKNKYDNCMDSAMSGWEGTACSQTYHDCLDE